MTEWGVAGIFAAIVLFGLSVGAPLLKLNSTITRLSTVIETLKARQDEDRKGNNEEHIAMWDKMEKQDEALNRHETDIAVIKEKVG